MTIYIVSSGQTSSGIVLNNSDLAIVSSGGTVSATTVNPGGLLEDFGLARATVMSGGTVELLGAAASAPGITGSGTLILASGAGIANVLANPHILYEVASGGSLTGMQFQSATQAVVFTGGTANFLDLTSGTGLAISGGRASGTTVEFGAQLAVMGGGVATSGPRH